jgi:uncharacterized membrane protein YqgA involved in biofilm formation
LVNVVAVVAGTAAGLLVGGRLTDRVREAVLSGIGLLTIGVGVSSFLETRNAVFPVVALIIGAVVGETLRLEERLEGLGERLRRRFERGEGGTSTFVEGYVTASLTFCIGALTVLGSLQDGFSGDTQLLVVKASLDGIISVVYAAAFGWGVAFSALTILVVQGSITAAGWALGEGVLTDRMVAELSATGGVMILGIGVRLLDLKKVPVASYLPGLAVAPVLVALFAR